MLATNAVTLLFNGLTLALALGFMLILLWYDSQKRSIQFFAVFLFLVTVWNAGSLIVQAVQIIGPNPRLFNLATGLMNVGFAGSSVALYVLVTILAGAHTVRFRVLAFASLLVVVGYHLLLIVIRQNNPTPVQDPISTIYFFTFGVLSVYLAWQFRRKLQSKVIAFGVLIFVIGQGFTLLNESVTISELSTNVAAVGALLISVAVLRQEIITPLSTRSTQLESMHGVSVAITTQLSLSTVLKEIATQAVAWLQADGVGIFLRKGEMLKLVTAHNLPERFVDLQVAIGQGAVGTAAATQQSVFVENYSRDWKQAPDLPLAKETFGSVIAVPLLYGSEVIGALLVIAGRQGRLFRKDDVYLLELLSAQAAVAITNSRLFTDQRELTQQVEDARSQLETFLISTDSPVIAVDDRFMLIFANPAAHRMFNAYEMQTVVTANGVEEVLPLIAFPTEQRKLLSAIDDKEVSTLEYEINHDERTYLCHLGRLKQPRLSGWIIVMNDITQLKELDRMKSEMVRMASHDLKNPLMGALLHIDLLRDDLDDTEQLNSLTTIETQLERMNRIIRGVLDLEHIRAGVSRLESCQVQPLVERAVADFQQAARDKSIVLASSIAETPMYIVCDPEQFERALSNLIENAVKFTFDGGRVDVRVRAGDGNVIIEVQDSGIGIPEGMQAQIFERFFRGRQQGIEHVTGSGLGLSIVKTIIENHQGKIWLKSQENKGTTFFVSIPLVPAPQPIG